MYNVFQKVAKTEKTNVNINNFFFEKYEYQ